MADSDRDGELDAQGLRHDFGLGPPITEKSVLGGLDPTEEAILHGIRFRMHSPFRPVGPEADPHSVLLAHLGLAVAGASGGGASHHLEAIAVEYDEDLGEWTTVALDYEEKLNDFMRAAGAGDPFERLMMNGREYVIVMTPYCE